jgi:LacI family transcriptional regulator
MRSFTGGLRSFTAARKSPKRGVSVEGNASPRVALLIETSNEYARQLLHGVIAFIRAHRPWSLYLSEHGRGERPPPWLKGWQGDGIIARIENRHIARAVADSGLPTVDVSAGRLMPELPWVETDDDAVADMAAEHLLERGLRHFAFCGDRGFQWARWRQAAFAKRVTAAGFGCSTYWSPSGADDPSRRSEDHADLGTWLLRLPKPVGILACYDQKGRQVIEVCRELGLAVPDAVAVVGVDNDELMCELCDPPLSSVMPNAHLTGYEAARLLHEQMAGQQRAGVAVRVKPVRLVARRSSDVLAIDDAEVALAARLIREHACDGISVAELARRTGLSRRVLDSRYSARLGRSPHAEILRLRVERAKQLLGETDLSLADIAERCGLPHAEYLSVLFKRLAGKTPSAWRTESRAGTGR